MRSRLQVISGRLLRIVKKVMFCVGGEELALYNLFIRGMNRVLDLKRYELHCIHPMGGNKCFHIEKPRLRISVCFNYSHNCSTLSIENVLRNKRLS